MSETTEERANKMSSNSEQHIKTTTKNPSREDKMDEGSELSYLKDCIQYTQLYENFRVKVVEAIRQYTVIMD